MRKHDPQADLGLGRDLDAPLDELVATEGLDDELLRQCHALLAEPPHEALVLGRRAHGHGTWRRARHHLLCARLAYGVGLLDRALEHAQAALAVAPDDEPTLELCAALHHRAGRLSEAVAIWEDLASRKAGEASALRHLARVFELSLQPPIEGRRVPPDLELALRGAVGDLEQSFRHAVAQNLGAALRTVDRVAARSHGKDAYVFKVAALQRAWLLEQARDVGGAIATLERLADEPGLTNDVERLLSLSILYEREGTPERIRRAVRAVRHAYLVTREPTLLRRMGRLLGKLGHRPLSDRFEAHYEAVFRRRMHGLTLREVVRAAATTFVPLERLRTLPVARRAAAHLLGRHADRKRTVHRRRAAVLALLLDDAARAHALLARIDGAGEATPLDLLYLGEAAERLGDASQARDARRRALRLDPRPDAVALLGLFGGDRPPRAEELRELLGTSARLEHAVVALRAHGKSSPANPDPWRALAELERALGHASRAAEHDAHAASLEAPREPGRSFIVLAAAALRRGGDVRGIMHELWVDFRSGRPGDGGALDPADVLGAVSGELRAYAVGVFHAARAFARARWPHRAAAADGRRFVLRVTKDDEPSSGDSAGLPLAVAFLSAVLDVPVPRDVAFTGAVVCDAHDVVIVRPVGDIEAKIAGAYERRLARLYVPAGNREDVERAERVPREVAAELVSYVRTLDDVVEALFPELG
jgi:tetratricopeptide (TPR) repeat protein